MRTIYRLEYLMPIEFSEIEAYVRGLRASDNDCYLRSMRPARMRSSGP